MSDPKHPGWHRPASALASGLALACGLSLGPAQAQSPAPAAPTAAPAAAPALQPALQPALHPALKAAAAEPGAVVTPSGLVFRQIVAGQGTPPKATDTVRVHYRGTFPDGREFDSSYQRGQPASFPLNRVIRCWTEGLQRMQPGATAQLTCPADIAYGERGTPGGPIPPNAVLRFEVKLLGVN